MKLTKYLVGGGDTGELRPAGQGPEEIHKVDEYTSQRRLNTVQKRLILSDIIRTKCKVHGSILMETHREPRRHVTSLSLGPLQSAVVVFDVVVEDV